LAAVGLLVFLGAAVALAAAPRGDVILGGSQSSVDYHAEAAPAKPADGGATIIGGNIQIASDRGARGGLAGDCDPDPRFGDHPRPDDQGCSWDEPVGAGEDFISFGRHIGVQDLAPDESGDTASSGVSGNTTGDTDSSPDGAFTPQDTPTRESFNGRGGLDKDGNLFIEDRPVLDDEDQNFRIRATDIFNYLAPQGNANNRWRRLCGAGVVSTFKNNDSNHGPFADGDVVPFVVQIWDADWKDPSDLDGGNQDYFIVDVFPKDTKFDVRSCRAAIPNEPPPPPPVAPPPPPPGPIVTPVAAPTPAPASAVKGVRVVRGTARIAAAKTCPVRPFNLRVQGRRIRSVTFFVDGKRLGTVTRGVSGRYTARLDPRRLKAGVHRVRARVRFVAGAGRARNLSMSFRVCARPAAQVQPKFTG
jgi:hypothetical protein